jgi:Na+-translocating ferredoxin:NAD+ oxidoreductase subunit E
MSKYIHELIKGLYAENPVFRLVIGLCPTLAVTTAVVNGIGMGIATTAVLVCSNLMIALIRNLVPKKIRIPIYIIVIATFVTIVEMVMQAFNPGLYAALGIFVPLIVVNCIIFARAEAYASRNSVLLSLLDGIGMGLGFTLALLVVSSIREIAGNGSFLGLPVVPAGYQPVLLMILPPGAFLTIGFILGFFNWLDMRKSADK